jgi:REP element-mobilizing transposase RayT
MQPKYEYRRRLPHYQKDEHPLFVTFTTNHRWELPPAAKDIVLECCLKENGHQFNLHAAVIMPDHVHLIYSPRRREDGWSYSLPEIMKAIKAGGALHQRCSRAQWSGLAGGVLRSCIAIE